MTMRKTPRFVLSAFVLAALAVAAFGARAEKPARFAEVVRKKPDVTIVVTDSGLGGLSVAADLAARLPASGIVRSARIVFVNAEPDVALGYNDMKLEADKVRVFDAALAAMETRYKPDLILIACNTLSVVYPGTAHAKKGRTETVEIVGLALHVVVAKGNIGFRVHEDDPRRADDAARRQPRREVGRNREPAEA